MIEFIDDTAIRFRVGSREIHFTLDTSMQSASNGEPMGRLELLLWGVIAATREQTRTFLELHETAKANGPTTESLIADVAANLGPLAAAFGGAAVRPPAAEQNPERIPGA